MRLVVEPMDLADISTVLDVDRESYTIPWPASAYRREILHNRNARYLVLKEVAGDESPTSSLPEPDHRGRLSLPFFRWPHMRTEEKLPRPGTIIGYAGMWIMVDDAHITTIALRTSRRGTGLGELLLASLIELASQIGARRVTLEVRVSNEVAQNLYRKYGFQQEGTRPRYYSDNNEDAYIMSTGDIEDPVYRRHFDRLIETLHHRLLQRPDLEVLAPAFPVQTEARSAREAD